MLARLITKGRVQEATEIVNGPEVQTVPVSGVDAEFIGEDTRVLAQIIRIKKGTGGEKKDYKQRRSSWQSHEAGTSLR